MHYTATPQFVLLSMLLLPLPNCGRDARGSDAPVATATAPRARSDQVHVPAPTVTALTPSEPVPRPSTRDVCPTIEFFSGVMIDVHSHIPWPAGKYRFVIEHDSKTTICTGRIPLPPGQQSIDIVCNSSGVFWEGDEFMINSHPALVDIVVLRDGVRLAHVKHKPEYDEFSPHGPECGTYRSAKIDLILATTP